MLCVIGLGNPGNQYDATRHNIGFDVIDVLARTLRVHLKAGKGEYLEAQGTFEGNDVHLAKPLTFMNNSGSAVMDLAERYEIAPDQLLVVCDDFQLPLGTLRLRQRGSDGGHNGLYSIIYHLQSDSFPRLRCGIASESIPKDKSLMAEYVLEPFTSAERQEVERMVTRAAEACLCIARDGIERAMNLYNTKPKQTEKD
ncbi:MAG: aminoacyl-tRNA hydrolase [Ignavibacteriae bacterium]|nr:aminoacyl-tRNA hydrolase [Ignavibacteriota bacterium]